VKKSTFAVLASLTLVAIVLPVIWTVNHSTITPAVQPTLQQVDGHPMPPPYPPYTVLSADGHPMPPPIPWYVTGTGTAS